MNSLKSRSLRAFFINLYRQAWQRRSFWIRLTLAWILATIFAILNHDINADYRFELRPAQSVSKKIILVEIDQKQWAKRSGSQQYTASLFREPNPLNDSYFWDEKSWDKLLTKILAQSPQNIGVTFYFGENSPQPSAGARRTSSFGHPKIIWGVQQDQKGNILPSYFAGSFTRNAGVSDIRTDTDGIARRISPYVASAPLISYQLARGENKHTEIESVKKRSLIINYRGPRGTFPTVTASDILKNKVSSNYFEDKIIIIGPAISPNFFIKTPAGVLSRAEFQANIVDNFLNDRWIKSIPFLLLLIILALLVWLSAWVTSNYPQLLAFVVIVMSQTIMVGASFFLFDFYYIYLPILPVSIALVGTYMIFLSFQLSIKDYENLRLENEKKFLVNVEELKNNFFSLISHDLKTPIAKIQGICDRMLAKNPSEEISLEIAALKTEARELNRYIKTLLQLTRVESQDFKVNREPLDLNEIIEQVVEILKPLAIQKNILLKLKLEPMFLIEADSLLMTEVVLNLLENAIKYSPEKSEVNVTSREVDGRVIFMVEDQGPGISVEDQKFVFEKFYRGEEGLNHSKGSGLGLYLVKYFIERHEGFVLLDSNLGTGTKVGFSVPVQIEALTEIEEAIGETDENSA